MAVSQINRALIRPVTIAAAIIGTIEALAWIGLSLVPILYYYSVILIDDTIPTNSYTAVIYQLFLNGDNKPEEIIVTPKVFNIFMLIVLASNFVWLMTSLYILWSMTRNKWKDGFAAIAGWSSLTLYISILDIILMSLIAVDFKTVVDSYPAGDSSPIVTTPFMPETEPSATTQSTLSTLLTTTFSTELTTTTFSTELPTTTPEEETTASDLEKKTADMVMRFLGIEVSDSYRLGALQQIIFTSYGIIMSLAARGYILLILNIVFAVLLMKFAFVIKNDAAPSLLPIIDAYATSGRPWNNLYDQTDIGNAYSNDGFTDENGHSLFPRSDSFITKDTEIRNHNPLSNGSNPYIQNFDRNQPSPPNPNIVEGRTAKIGKKSGTRTPPLNVPPPVIPASPYIPDPDYSPPGSPKSKPKSVLRPKSNYVL